MNIKYKNIDGKCFAIIKEGSGTDFDPVIADLFIEIRDKVEKIHNDINTK